MQKLFVAIAIVTLAVSAVSGQSQACMGCICEAASHCDLTTCSFARGVHCGPFEISLDFWKDAGQPVLLASDHLYKPGGNWKDCANDWQCAVATVVLYVNKFRQDCDNDGAITCMDYALLHRMGGYSCKARGYAIPRNDQFDRVRRCIADNNIID